jgi:hypothetical protein
MNTSNIDFDLIKQQRDELLGHVWHHNKPLQPVSEELAWGVISMMDDLLDQNEKEKNEIFR